MVRSPDRRRPAEHRRTREQGDRLARRRTPVAAAANRLALVSTLRLAHGYELELHTEIVDPTRPAPWSKIALLRRLAASHELLLWLDADLVVVDPRSISRASSRTGRFLYLVEHETQEGRMPNSGVMLLRGGEETIAFLDEVYAQEDLVESSLVGERRDLPPARLSSSTPSGRERRRRCSPSTRS